MADEGLGSVAAITVFLTIVVFTILGIMAQKHGERIGEVRGEARAKRTSERRKVYVGVRRLQRAFKEFAPQVRRADDEDFKSRYKELRSLRERLEETYEWDDTRDIEWCLEEIKEYFDELTAE